MSSCLQPCLDLEARKLIASSKCLLSLPCPLNREEAYIHPLSISKPFLSSKSLEMCTESLGTETGSGIDQFSHMDAGAEMNCRAIHHARKQMKKAKHEGGGGGGGSFPPPLSSMSGVQIHTHREGGRLVIKAFAYQSRGSYLRAERGNGRLRLSLLRDADDYEEEEPDPFWGESVKEEAGKLWSRCNGERTMHTFQFCVVGV